MKEAWKLEKEESKKRLGRGLAALIGNNYKPADSNNSSYLDEFLEGEFVPIEDNLVQYIDVNHINRSTENPRHNFSTDELMSLSASIAEHGVLQPIIVRKLADNNYQIIAGERRWRAAKAANLAIIPAIIKHVEDSKALELAIVENIQRADLDPVEEARGYKQLLEHYNYTQEDLAKKLGKSRPYITNMLRLLTLPEEVQLYLETGQLNIGQARCLINLPNAVELAKKIIAEQLSVRQVEEMLAEKPQKKPAQEKAKPEELVELEEFLGNATQLEVKVQQGKKGGKLIFKYKDLEELTHFCEQLQS